MILIADSGSTKTDWALACGATMVKRIATQGINPFHQDMETVKNILEDELLPHLCECEVDAVYFYGSGCREEFVPAVTGVFAEVFPGVRQIEARGDLLGAARALCGAGEGIACILGTGANSCLYDGKTIVMNTPPLGYILGDEGSGAVLGRLFVNAMFKGVLPDSVRREYLSSTGQTMADIIRRVYREPLANRYLASMAPFIHEHLDCTELRAVVTDNFRAFFRRNISPYNHRELPVNVVGSIAHYFKAELDEAARAEDFTLGLIERSPMAGLVKYHSAG